VPFMTRMLMFFTTIAVWMPIVNLLLVALAWKDRAALPPEWLKWLKYLFWAALAVNASLLLSMLFDHYFGGAPRY